MFVNTDFVFEIIPSVIAKGKFEPDDPIFQSFNIFLKGLGLDAVLTTFHVKPWNEKERKNSGNGNSIDIYLGSTENFKVNGFTNEGNWGGSYPNTELIKAKWKELAIQYNLPEPYRNNISYVWVYDFENCYLTVLVQNSKDELIHKIKKKIWWSVKPKYIFSNSTPAFNIIFEDAHKFSIAQKKGYFEKIQTIALDILTANDKFHLFSKNNVKINFLHIGMEGTNLHGLSRED